MSGDTMPATTKPPAARQSDLTQWVSVQQTTVT